MTEETKQDDGSRLQRWVYAGQRIDDWANGKLTNLWIVMAVDGAGHFKPTDKEYRFDTRITRKVIGARDPAVGSTWDFWVTPTETGISVTTGGEKEPQPVTRYDSPEVIEWEARSKVAQNLKDARKAARELGTGGGSELADLLAPIKRIYWKESHAGKAALLAAVIAEITGSGDSLPGKPTKSRAKGRK